MKFCSIACVTGWMGFWTFGFLALSAPQGEPAVHTVTAILLAFLGLMAGSGSWLKLAREVR